MVKPLIPISKLQSAIEFLEPLVNDERKRKIMEVLSHRTEHVIPVLEGIYDMGNLHAVVRTAEGLGFHALHLVETQENYKLPNRVTQSTDKWLEITKWKAVGPCFQELKNQGYQIACSSLSTKSIPLNAIDLHQKTALVFGNERSGASQEALDLADHHFQIPMVGFAQSFNISVAAAISLAHVRDKITSTLSVETQRRFYAEYLLRSVSNPDPILRGILGYNASL